MSKAFTKDDDREAPLFVRPRAPLPPGVPNYVTPRGLKLLRAELAELDAARERVGAIADDAGRRSRLAALAARRDELARRIAGANVVDARGQNRSEVRFGATVTLRTVSGGSPGEERRFTIVGVDEADAAHGRVAFVAPIACAILGREAGDTASLRTVRGEEVLEIVAVAYDEQE